MRAIAVFGFFVVLVTMTGCGAEPSGPTSASPSASSPSSATPSAAPSSPAPSSPASSPTTTTGDELTITVQDASGATTSWRLTCDPPGGTHPDAETACRVLDERGATALPAVPKGRMCTEVYGGPETATITGTWRGRPVLSRLSRINGCEISRWSALEGLLPKAGA